MKQKKEEQKRHVTFHGIKHSVLFSSKREISSKQKKLVIQAILIDPTFKKNIQDVLRDQGEKTTQSHVESFVNNVIIPAWEKDGKLEQIVKQARQLEPSEVSTIIQTRTANSTLKGFVS